MIRNKTIFIENLDHLITQRQLEDLEIEEAEQILDQPTQPRQTWR